MLKTISILAIALLLGACSRHSAPAAAASSPASTVQAAGAAEPAELPPDLGALVKDAADAGMGRGPESEGGTWYGAQGGKCVVIDSGPAVAFNQLRNAGFSPKTVEYRDNDSALTKVDVVYNVALTWKKDESEVDCLAAVPAHEEHPSDVQVASPGDQGAADGAPWQWGDDVASPAGGEWYFAEPDLGTCQHMSTKVVQMAEAYWKERGQYPLRDVAKSGFASIVIPQGGNKMLTAFASEADCWRSIGK